MGRAKLLTLLSLIPVLISYNNCSRSSGDTLSSASSESFLPGASGVLSNGDFEFRKPMPGCDEEIGAAAAVLSINTQSNESGLEERGCSEQQNYDLDFQALKMKSHNAYMVHFDDKLFVSSYLHQGVEGHLYYKEFCFNDAMEMSFTIQYIDTVVPGMVQPLKQYVGITMMGDGAELPGIQFNGGYLTVSSDGAKHLEAMNGAFDFYMEKRRSDGLKMAIYEKSDGRRIPMTCWYYKP